MTDKIILNIDASALSESSCIRRFYWTVVSGFRQTLNYNDVEFGSAFHEFVKVWRNNPGRFDLASAAALARYAVPMDIKPEKSYMDNNYLLNTCFKWVEHDKKDEFTTLIEPTSGRLLVEAKFSYPYYVDDQFEVNLCGTIDDCSQHKHGTYCLRDYKTTSVWKQNQYLAGYALSPQLMFYRMMIHKYAELYPNSIYADMDKKTIACFIDAVFLAGKAKPPEFCRSEMFFFGNEQLAEFEQLVARKIDLLLSYCRNEVSPPREGMLNGSCKTVYGLCKFFNACKQVDHVICNHVLNNQFIKRQYNPLKFNEKQNNTPTIS